MTKNLVLQPGTVKSFYLVLLALATAIFPRVITAVGAPAVINFLHFAFVIVLLGLMLSKIRSYIAKKVLFGLLVLLGLILSSALVNSAGVINVILDFLLLAEPFMLLIAIVSTQMSQASIERFRFWLMLFAFIHILFAYFQFFVLGLEYDADQIKGVFLKMGAGHHVGGGVALTTAVYFFVASGIRSIWIRIFVAIIFTYEVVLCDAKQVFAVFLVSLIILLSIKLNNIGKFLQYFAIASVTVGIVLWAAYNIMPALTLGLDSDRVSKGLESKFSVFSIIISYYHSPLNWLFGLGPGHTISRLGWLIPDYMQYLNPLGVTTSPIFKVVWDAQEGNYYSNSGTGSSLYSLLFSWAGLWGDLGLVGLGAYLYLWFLVWHQLCLDDLSRFFAITIFVFGTVFSWMEEPGYMLFVVSLIGLQWQKHQISIDSPSKKNKNNSFIWLHNVVTETKSHF